MDRVGFQTYSSIWEQPQTDSSMLEQLLMLRGGADRLDFTMPKQQLLWLEVHQQTGSSMPE